MLMFVRKTDPDGNKMEMQTEIIKTVEDFEAYKATGKFAKNPVSISKGIITRPETSAMWL